LTNADDDLEGVAEGVRIRDEEREEKADGAPGKLFSVLSVIGLEFVGGAAGEWTVKKWRGEAKGGRQTAVTVSMQRTKGSEVKYLESESAYSFHNCPKRSCAGPIWKWLREKYPVNN
jgi:hypothetical protein